MLLHKIPNIIGIGISNACGNLTDENPFGLYKEVKNGGKIIAMGDGMVSLYMNEWEGVKIINVPNS